MLALQELRVFFCSGDLPAGDRMHLTKPRTEQLGTLDTLLDDEGLDSTSEVNLLFMGKADAQNRRGKTRALSVSS